MKDELLDRIEKIESMGDLEFLYNVVMELELEIPGHAIRIIEGIEGLVSIRFGKYSVLITKEELETLKDIEDPFALDRYLLAHFLKDGLTIDAEDSEYLKYIFGRYYSGDF